MYFSQIKTNKNFKSFCLTFLESISLEREAISPTKLEKEQVTDITPCFLNNLTLPEMASF